MSASNIAQYGPAITWVASRTIMPSSNVAWDINGSVGIVTLNRPEARNALTWDMYDALVEACDTAEADQQRARAHHTRSGRRVRRRHRHFAVQGLRRRRRRRLRAAARRGDRSHRAPAARSTIAEVDGAAVGGGCAIAMACDLRICSERARVRRAGGAHARQLPVDGEHGAHGRSDRPGADARSAADRPADRCATKRWPPASPPRCVPSASCSRRRSRSPPSCRRAQRSTIDATKAMLLRLRDHRRPPAGRRRRHHPRVLRQSTEFKEGVDGVSRRPQPDWS